MKENSFAALLIGILALGAATTAVLSVIYVRNVKTLQTLQFQAAVINQNRAIIRDLAAEAVEYSKRNTSIEKVLDSVGIKIRPGATQSGQMAPTKK